MKYVYRIYDTCLTHDFIRSRSDRTVWETIGAAKLVRRYAKMRGFATSGWVIYSYPLEKGYEIKESE